MNPQISIINVENIVPNRFQPRKNFDPSELQELADSIKQHGMIQPMVLRKLGDKYEIIAGERRYKSALMIGMVSVPAIIMNLDDATSAEVALIENVQRRDLTPVEEAQSYRQILQLGQMTQDEMAKKMGKNQSTISNKLRLLNLSNEVQQALLENKISERHARSLLSLKDINLQNQLLQKIIEKRLTVREVDSEIKSMLTPTPKEDEILNFEDEIIDFEDENKELIPEPLLTPEKPLINEEVIKQAEVKRKSGRFFNFQEEEDTVDNKLDNYVPEKPALDNANIYTQTNQQTNFTPPQSQGYGLPQVSANPYQPVNDNNYIPNQNVNNQQINQNPYENVGNEQYSNVPNSDYIQNLQGMQNNNNQPYYGNPQQSNTPVPYEQQVYTNPQPAYQQNNNQINNTPPAIQNVSIPQFGDSNMGIHPEEAPQSMIAQQDITGAVSVIRNTIMNLQNNGYMMDAEEFDFDSHHQIIIKIQK